MAHFSSSVIRRKRSKIAVDAFGTVYIIGTTAFSNFPMQYTYNGTFNGVNDAFISKFDLDGGFYLKNI
ncbi:MAG: hypothetical protein ACTSXH_13780 [Promethearchaeota archaeon]